MANSGGWCRVPLRPLQSVDNALRTLQLLARPPGHWGVTEVARELGVSKSVAHGLLGALRARQFAEQDPHTRRYRLGPALHLLSQASGSPFEVRRLAWPVMQRLARAADESVYLMVPVGLAAVLVERADPPNPVRVTMEVGMQGPLHAGSSPKAILAFMSDEEIQSVITHGLPSLTRRTPTNPDHLWRQVAEYRQTGYVYTEEEAFEGVAGLAAPIYGPSGRVAGSLGVAGLIQRLRPKRQALPGPVIEAAREISGMLGHGTELRAGAD